MTTACHATLIKNVPTRIMSITLTPMVKAIEKGVEEKVHMLQVDPTTTSVQRCS